MRDAYQRTNIRVPVQFDGDGDLICWCHDMNMVETGPGVVGCPVWKKLEDDVTAALGRLAARKPLSA